MPDSFLGAGLAFFSAVCFACSNVFVSKSPAGASDSRGVLLSIFFTLAISSLVWLIVEGGDTGGVVDEAWLAGIGWFALAGFFAVVLGRRFLYASIRHLGVTRASAVKRLNPFFSVFLAFVLVGEPITGLGVTGMLLVAISLAILVQRSFAMRESVDENEPGPIDYLWGVGSAFSYASSYVARKYGLALIAAPAFGTMVSAVAGLLFFAVAALFVRSRRADFRYLFRGVDRWLVAAGLFISFGQIGIFGALFYEKISTVVMIASLETFIASYLSVVVFRTEARPDIRTMIAATLATLGVIAVVAG